MNLLLDNRTLTVVQVAVSLILCAVMLVGWRTQKTYPGFGLWTVGKIPNALGWLLISLRGFIPDWSSILLGNGLLLISPILTFAGIRLFRGKNPNDNLIYVFTAALGAAFFYFTAIQPDINGRMVLISVFGLVLYGRCAMELLGGVPSGQRSDYWFTAAMFGLYSLVLFLRVASLLVRPNLTDPFDADPGQTFLFIATCMAGIGWTFGFFLMTNQRLTTDLLESQEELRGLVATDLLTGALNRRSFNELSQRERERARRIGQSLFLATFDVDHFKKLNDTHGMRVGDEILRAVVSACRTNLRASDLLARWEGGKFIVLLPDTNRIGGLQAAEKLRRQVEEMGVSSESGRICTTISLGCALWYPQDEAFEDVFRRADRALYQAKQHGRNCVMM